MSTEIVIVIDDLRLNGYLNDSPTAQALADALPIEGRAQLWGEEIYFPVDRVVAELDESAAVVVNVGDLGYWPTGRAFCIFFGLTPGSVPGEIRPASAVNLVGRVTDDPCCLKLIKEGAPVRIERKSISLEGNRVTCAPECPPEGAPLDASFEIKAHSFDDHDEKEVLQSLPPTATAVIDLILEKLEWGIISFNIPESMNLRDTAMIQLVLSLDKTIEELNQLITASGKKEWAKIRVANVMEARLTGPNYRITAITPEEQAITGQENTLWAWEIKPTRPGKSNLHLTLNAKFILEGRVASRAIRTFDKYIEVNVTFGQKISGFIGKHWKWLIVAIIIPLLTWLYNQFNYLFK